MKLPFIKRSKRARAPAGRMAAVVVSVSVHERLTIYDVHEPAILLMSRALGVPYQRFNRALTDRLLVNWLYCPEYEEL